MSFFRQHVQRQDMMAMKVLPSVIHSVTIGCCRQSRSSDTSSDGLNRGMEIMYDKNYVD